LGGHCGIAATYNKVKALFAWPNMKQAVKEYVNQCQVCQQAKPEHTKLPGLLQPLPIPEQAWHTISMDFVEGLPKSKGYDTILVVVDKLTKYGHFLPLAHPFAALTIAKLFHNNVYKLHGLPQVIISDPDKVFTSTLWRELFRLSERTLMSPRGGVNRRAQLKLHLQPCCQAQAVRPPVGSEEPSPENPMYYPTFHWGFRKFRLDTRKSGPGHTKLLLGSLLDF
jgi:hypothetical protein